MSDDVEQTQRGRGSARRVLAALLGLGLVALCVGWWLRFQPAELLSASGRPNVVMISIDTLRADHLSLYGYSRETSPRIDALARRGVTFDNAFAHSPKTAVSHMSLFTGLTPEAHGVRQWAKVSSRRLSDDIPTLASLLQDAGYYTAAITSGGHMRAELGFDDGMQFFQVVPDLRRAFRRARDVLTERAGGGDRLAPFFLFVHTYEVHAPYTPIAPYDSLFTSRDYQGGIVSSQRDLVKAAAGDWGRQHEIFWQAVDETSEADLQHLQDLYDGSIRFVDDQIGEFLDWLSGAGVLDQTLVIVLSDHGEEFLDHGRFQHNQAYEELLRVPLVMAFPGPPGESGRGVREGGLVRLVDVAPTVLDFLGVPLPDHVEGVSLLPLLAGGAGPPEVVISGWPEPGIRSLRRDDWKLIERRSSAGKWVRLYDLQEDPAEQLDLAESEPGRRDALRQHLRAMEMASRAFRDARERGRAVEPDEEAIEHLRALGYIE